MTTRKQITKYNKKKGKMNVFGKSDLLVIRYMSWCIPLQCQWLLFWDCSRGLLGGHSAWMFLPCCKSIINPLTQQPVANDTKWTHLIFLNYIKALLKREKGVATLSSSVVLIHSLSQTVAWWHSNSARTEWTERDTRLQPNRNTCAVRHN